MILDKSNQAFLDEALTIYKENSHGNPNTNAFFGVVEDGILKAIGSVRCYYGHWYLRGAFVKPEYRKQGLQRRLIRERLDYLSPRTNVVRASIFPWNTDSIKNIEAEKFALEKTKKLQKGGMANIYVYKFKEENK